MDTGEYRVQSHYGRSDLESVVLAALGQALGAADQPPGPLAVESLAPIDQLHTGGRDATLELAGLAGLDAGERVLDVGGGVGGPARTLAATRGCSVMVLDLTAEFCRLGAELTRRTGLGDLVTFRHGSGLAIPFPDGAFDVGWTQHSTMNIADKPRLYAELHRVIRPGGRLAMHEIVHGPAEPIAYPVPWAADPSISFLLPAASVRTLLREAGFVERAWVDVSASALAWTRDMLARGSAGPPPPLGLHLLLGPGFRAAVDNLARNLEERRVEVVQGVWERSSDREVGTQ